MKFIKAEISESLGFDQIWNKIKPYSQLGILTKNKATPYYKKDRVELEEDLDKLELLIKKLDKKEKIDELKHTLSQIKDIRGTVSRSRNSDSSFDDIDLYEIKNFLLQYQKIRSNLVSLELINLFNQSVGNFDNLVELLSIGQVKQESFYLADDYSNQLAKIREQKKELEQKLLDLKQQLTTKIEEIVNRPVSVSGEINISKTDQDLINELQEQEQVSLVRENFSTLTFKIISNEKIINLEEELENIELKEEKCKTKVRKKLTLEIAKYSSELLVALRQIGYLDFLLAKAEFSCKIDGVKPQITTKQKLKIKQGRHLLVEHKLAKDNLEFTPLDIEISSGSTIITGPNMGGKTVSLKLIGLLVVMAQYGIFVPATKMKFNLRNFVYFSITSDSLETGLSTFGTEIANLQEIIEVADQDGLILIDEIAHGTNPQEGFAIAAAIINNLDEMDSISLFTTHFERLATRLNVYHLQVKGLDEEKMAKLKGLINEQGLKILNQCMNYELEEAGATDDIPYDALRVAELLGFDGKILQEAKSLLETEFESNLKE